MVINSLPNDKILDLTKLKAFADDKTNVTEKLKFVLGRVENMVEKGENAGYQHFLLSHHVFKRLLIQGRWKSWLFGKELNNFANIFIIWETVWFRWKTIGLFFF